jgi:hypothetical protein
MSKLNVNFIVNKNDDGAPELTYGAIVPPGQTLDINGSVNIIGVVTATNFVGDGSGLTQLSIATKSKSLAFKKSLGYDEYRS